MTATMTPFIPTLRGNAGKASRIRGEGKIKGKLKGEFFFRPVRPYLHAGVSFLRGER